MKYIIFFILETPSHLNSSFLIAKSLRSKGYEIIYIIFSNKYLELLSNEGFKYEFIKDFNISRNRTNNFFSRSNLLLFYQAKSDFKREFLSGSIFNSIIRKYNPSLFIVDLSLIFYSIILWEKNIPFIITCTKVSLNFDKIIPPFTSNVIPKFFRRNFKDKIIILFIWAKRLLYQYAINKYQQLSIYSISHLYLVREYCKLYNLNFNSIINTKRCTHFGWKFVPEIILSPKYFDFPRQYNKNQTHVGPVVDFNRSHYFCNDSNLDRLKSILDSDLNSNSKILFCSFGSYDFKYNKSRFLIFRKLISIISKRNDFILILSFGRGISSLKSGFNNIYFFNDVPQISVLEKTALMINHGGMQSVTECIMLEVPMLVFPLNPDLDQKGNAARVVYHKVGLRGNLKKENPKSIELKIDQLINNRNYFVSNIKKLKEKMLDSGDFDKGIAFIEDYIKNPTIRHESSRTL
ncbi:glycosyltransferase family 1 protein [Cyclobacterium sp. SYSU L10401]|uniref:glycosyltransferase family 1 protein n=1 Tax=Cyclobacterium sp. SYSU L10401 TaxID=2678657 RepID=UPI0013D202ED|nr:glycosyltransferase family 1 protein [Cyclobacterium sp. SYSU L10401]